MTRSDLLLVNDIRNIFVNGTKDENPRPKYEDGTPAHTYFVNHVVRTYNLQIEFPICTLRPIAWKSAIKELLWIYQDQSSSLHLLKDKYNVNYWDAWESKDIPGTIGIRYGATVRKHNLLNNLITGIKENPYGRRHIMSLWQEEDFKESDGLMPCAFLTIWNARGEYLDMCLIQRSGDMITASGAGGVNEVQYACLQMMIAKATGYKPGKFTHFVANEQIYDRHFDAANELINRSNEHKLKISTSNGHYDYEFEPVKMNFNPKSDNFYDFSIEDFSIENYNPITPNLKLELGI